MDGWQIIPWNLQYLAGFLFSLVITIYIFRRSKFTKVNQIFSIYGICVMGWNSFVFVHRSAPNSFISNISFRLSSSFGFFMFAIISLMLLYMFKKRFSNILILIPAFIISSVVIIYGPIDIVQTEYGWCFNYHDWFFLFFILTFLIFYFTATGLIGLWIIKKVKSKIIRYKIKLIIIATLVVYFGGLLFTNLILLFDPLYPPFGGFITTLHFVLISYAIIIDEEDIELIKDKTDRRKVKGILIGKYVRFLNKFRSEMPGKELGENFLKFEDHVESMGLSNLVRYKNGKLSFNKEGIGYEDIEDIPAKILDVTNNLGWADSLITEYNEIFHYTYQYILHHGKSDAQFWMDRMIKFHGPYLYHKNILDDSLIDLRLQDTYNHLEPRKIKLLKEEKPKKVYKLVEKAHNCGYHVIYLSKYRHFDIDISQNHAIKLKLKPSSGEIILKELSSKGKELRVKPENTAQIKKIMSRFLETNFAGIIIIDSLDKMMLNNTKRKTLRFLSSLVDMVKKKDGILLVSIDLNLIKKSDLEEIEHSLGR